MEFHISRSLRQKLDVDDSLFNFVGNVVFGNLTACRRLAKKMNDAREAEGITDNPINAGALFAMGLIDELSHAIFARYRATADPSVLPEALQWFEANSNSGEVDKLLLGFTREFPNSEIYRGKITDKKWLAGSTNGQPHREAELEELFLLWLANINPAFKPFRELFDDRKLQQETIYKEVTSGFNEYFASRPAFNAKGQNLLDVLVAPMLASPESLTGQLSFMQENWGEHIGTELRQILLAIDVVREEDLAIWARFHPPSQMAWHPPLQQGWGGEGFEGNEFTGFQRGGQHGGEAPGEMALNEYEAFSPDESWMPTVVMVAKSTYVWLEQLSKKYGRHIHRLDHIPNDELALLADRGLNALWLIGLWERSTASQTIKRLRGQHDAVASAYSLKDYRIADDLGGNGAYENLRDRAARFGLRLASDMVPNHMGIDSYWVIEHPEWFLTRPDSPYPVYSFNGPDLSPDPRKEIKIEDHYFDQTDAAVVFRLRDTRNGQIDYIYHGNDGTTFAWNDTAQLNYLKAEVREQVMQTILHVARLFPIIRFDAAMTLARRHVQRLWFPLPGQGGSIPSRSEYALTQEEFDAAMPEEFWRQVVDRVAVEAPGTLLLAEAFWLLEGYFVRTLGMHRVYNSAFMNMLRDEENAKYRSYLKKTIEFDPDILKRYVNFMSNPDERTAIDQFGTGDKYFGTCVMLATLPGLPMFGHGQIEGYTEKYGMEYKQARFDERPNEGLIARHQHEIAPLLKNRKLFAESHNFVMFDFWTGDGTVDENVYAYSNRLGDERALVIFNNIYANTQGTIHYSAASMDKGSGQLRQRSLADALGLWAADDVFIAYRNTTTGLEYLHRSSDICNEGFTLSLRGFQYAVLQQWHPLYASEERPWDQLCYALNGTGVYNLDEALTRLQLRPLHESLHQALSHENVEAIAALATELAGTPVKEKEIEKKAKPQSTPLVKDGRKPVPEKTEPEKTEADPRLEDFFTKAGVFYGQINIAQTEEGADIPTAPMESLRRRTLAVLGLPEMEQVFALHKALPEKAVLPFGKAATVTEWAPVVAWLLLGDLFSAEKYPGEPFDRLQMRQALGETFALFGLEGEDAWRAAARVRVLITMTDTEGLVPSDTKFFWNDGDVRWLAGANEHQGHTYLNQQQLSELLTWTTLPEIVDALEHDRPWDTDEIAAVQAAMLQAAEDSGYDLDKTLTAWVKLPEDEEILEDSEVDAEEITIGDVADRTGEITD
ncbi:alpha-amylase family glycosyl hydrolase [Silvibacterium acidisoli]|uniref:alpha-amylase family glycosyl hydrolase n=1 Tax=Acidobacteriaceae bacterium ZG23-2 TaxID=2883246 RepID=UPI00406D1CF4